MWHVLEHLRNPAAVLERCYGLLASGGVLAIEVPNLDFVVRKSYEYPLSVTLHLFHFSPASLRRIVGNAGFDVLECTPGNTGLLYSSRAKVFAKKALQISSSVVHRLTGRNISDSIRLFARKPRAEDVSR